MLKHPEITRRRIDAFYQSELRDRLIVDRAPLSLEIADVCASTPVDAASWPWQPAAPGLRYGPAYRAWWFRVRGRTPERFLDWEVQLAANVGGERTIWRGGQPVWGLDAEHEGFIWPGAWG
ncbi:MAG: hypothetical protein HY248_06485, partial [Fimbriimonas ginsengisoli]|nr:hypothetical protein [Fimbriimonas ginsengisoli]